MFNTIKRFFYWGWKLRKSYDFDYAYLEEMILVKLIRIEKAIMSPKAYFEFSKKDKRRMATIIELFKRLNADEYYKNVKTWFEREKSDRQMAYYMLGKYGPKFWD